MVITKRILLSLLTLGFLLGGVSSCNSPETKTETPAANSETSANGTADVPENSESEPDKGTSVTTPSPSPYVAPPVTPAPSDTPSPIEDSTPKPSVTPSTPPTNPLTPNVKPEPIYPPAIEAPPVLVPPTIKPIPSVKPKNDRVIPDNELPETIDPIKPIEPAKPAPKPKSESKTNPNVNNAIANRKKVFAKAYELVENKDAKFIEFYKKLEVLVNKVETQRPLTQGAIDAVNKLTAQYPTEATKFNLAIEMVMPKGKK